MKISEYNQMVGYLTRPSKSTKGSRLEELASQRQLEKYATQKNYGGNLWKQFVKKNEAQEKIEKKLDTNLNSNAIDILNTFEDNPHIANAKVIAKNKTPLATEKNNIIIAMSETPSEEYEMQLGAEIEQFQKWLKENKNGTYQEFLDDKTAMLTEEQKKDPKIIDLEPYLPNFEDVIKKYEKEKEEESLNDFIKRRSNEMRLAEADSFGVSTLFKKRL